ncbi:MAG TPA: hypothetical protein VMK12_24615 [Anaeromyxobacteraceae bacterium]|nr:hypothetical protein [Anaeromyxobacteraceae bacterium]
MASKDDWPCRRAELSQLIQAFEYGAYPPAPSSVTGSLSSDGLTLTVTVNYGSKSITFSPTVALPTGSGPFPVYVGLGAPSMGSEGVTPFDAPTITARGIAYIEYDTYDMAMDAPGKFGKFYTLYGTSVTSGVLMAWGWGVHRIVDALGQIPTFDATKVAAHGFSRFGKGALVTGAFDERIALTMASSSGAGGIGSWRVADVQTDSVQTLQEVLGESPHWFTSALQSFSGKTNNLPFDGHSVAALVAPRPLLVTEGSTDTWNDPIGCYTAAAAAKILFDYVAPADTFGFSSMGFGHAFVETAAALAFIDRFLLGKSTKTKYFENPGNFTVDPSYIPWTAP